jgi:hypothetical protein
VRRILRPSAKVTVLLTIERLARASISALGQKQTFAVQNGMSASHPIADMCGAKRNVRFVPIADIAVHHLSDAPVILPLLSLRAKMKQAATGGLQAFSEITSAAE